MTTREREISTKIKLYAKQYPIITIVGPRQSGKTTLAKEIFADKPYISLEDLDNRNFATEDPKGFLKEYAKGAIIDEVQRAPDLCSYLQTIVDEDDQPGKFILTGSQQFEIFNNISQSLAGRTAIVKLLPFTMAEAYPKKLPRLEELLYRGFYPRIFAKNLVPTEMLSFYTETYLERDVRNLINVKDLAKFNLFLRLCAARTGQLVNLSNIANECGVQHNTIKSWLNILEASFVIKLLQPYHQNINKRLVKAPKLFFLDVGLASFLLGINEQEQLKFHPLKGALFETLIVSELLKQRFNQGQRDNLYFYRDSNGNEIDIIKDNGVEIELCEVKLAQTVSNHFFRNFVAFPELENIKINKSLIYGGQKSYQFKDYQILSYKDL